MKIVFAGNKERGAACLRAVVAAGHEVALVVAHPGAAAGAVGLEARALDLPLLDPSDVNAPEVIATVAALAADAVVLAGYGQIVRRELLGVARLGCVNLHGGRLPQYRGSSPLNWALINGETEIGISVIQVDEGVDTGDVLGERLISVGPDDTIADVQARANDLFPELLLEVLDGLIAGTVVPRRQDDTLAAYYPLRFPDDGLVLWDTLDAAAAHNRIRALTHPFPGAFTLHRGRRVTLLRSRLEPLPTYGEPGRVQRATADGLLVAAADRCLWVTEARYADDSSDAIAAIPRYDTLATLRAVALAFLEERS